MATWDRPISFGMKERKWLDAQPPVQSLGQLRARLLCQHADRTYPVADVRGATVIANRYRYSLTGETSDVAASCMPRPEGAATAPR